MVWLWWLWFLASLVGGLFYRGGYFGSETSIEASEKYLEVGEIVSNLSARTPGLVKTRVVLRFRDEKSKKRAGERLPELRHKIVSVMYELSLAEIDPSERLERSAREVEKRLEGTEGLKGVLVTEFYTL